MLAAIALLSLASISAAHFNTQHQVIVGGPGLLRFTPEFVNAVPGDTILFTFKQKNHSATQSNFHRPCSPITGGFDSGFQPVADNVTDGPFPTAQLAVQHSHPIWMFCRQVNHCQQGMVFAVNPGDRFAAFQAAANASTSTPTAMARPTPEPIPTCKPSVVTVTTTFTARPLQTSTKVHQIVVGGPGRLFYDPANITAQPGDTITFSFRQKNHTVTQSTFENPCRSIGDTSRQVGFDSGFMPVADNATIFPNFTITVKDNSPIWAFCRQTGHCGAGMVFAANAVENGTNNFAAFQALARKINGTATTTSLMTPTTAPPPPIGSGVSVPVAVYEKM